MASLEELEVIQLPTNAGMRHGAMQLVGVGVLEAKEYLLEIIPA
jgi:hypothetical protein